MLNENTRGTVSDVKAYLFGQSCYYDIMPMQYTAFFTAVKRYFSDEKL